MKFHSRKRLIHVGYAYAQQVVVLSISRLKSQKVYNKIREKIFSVRLLDKQKHDKTSSKSRWIQNTPKQLCSVGKNEEGQGIPFYSNRRA